jgi:hypothetical protein
MATSRAGELEAERYGAIEQAIAERLQERHQLFQALREKVAAFADREGEGRTFLRRPPIGFRLPAEDLPPGHVAVTPRWLKGNVRRKVPGRLVTSEVDLELVETRMKVFGDGRPTREMSLRVTATGCVARRYYPSHWGACLGRIVLTVEQFLQEPFIVFARSSDACCVCGRGLSDQLSRSRGVGPECLRGALWFRDLVEQDDKLTAMFEADLQRAFAICGINRTREDHHD